MIYEAKWHTEPPQGRQFALVICEPYYYMVAQWDPGLKRWHGINPQWGGVDRLDDDLVDAWFPLPLPPNAEDRFGLEKINAVFQPEMEHYDVG